MGFETKRIHSKPDVIAPDGSEVRVLCQFTRGPRGLFAAAERRVESRRASHGRRSLVRMWRKLGDQEEIAELGPGVSLTIPTGTHFQFRCDGHEPLNVIGATMPPWPGENEAFFVDGAWQPTA
jgi:hypothetical protein